MKITIITHYKMELQCCMYNRHLIITLIAGATASSEEKTLPRLPVSPKSQKLDLKFAAVALTETATSSTSTEHHRRKSTLFHNISVHYNTNIGEDNNSLATSPNATCTCIQLDDEQWQGNSAKYNYSMHFM